MCLNPENALVILGSPHVSLGFRFEALERVVTVKTTPILGCGRACSWVAVKELELSSLTATQVILTDEFRESRLFWTRLALTSGKARVLGLRV